MMRSLRSAVVVSITAALVGAAALPAPAASRTGRTIDVEEDCLEPVPESVSVAGVTDDGKNASLDVLVLLDNVTQERGDEVFAKAQEAYTPLHITLDVRYESVSFSPDEVVDEVPRIESTRALEEAKKWTAGKRPADVDLVYVLTEKDLSDAAGRADCIGGVRYEGSAFAVGENYRHEELLGVFYKFGTAKIAAHEIGHVMGAHHHYANCAEGVPGAVREVGPTPCSTMFNFIDFLSLGFSVLEGAAIRGHTVDFATGGPDINPVHSTTATLEVAGGTASGAVSSSSSPCFGQASVALQRETPDEWITVASTRSTRKGTYRVSAPAEAGQYRAFVAERKLNGAEGEETCAQSASPPIAIGG